MGQNYSKIMKILNDYRKVPVDKSQYKRIEEPDFGDVAVDIEQLLTDPTELEKQLLELFYTNGFGELDAVGLTGEIIKIVYKEHNVINEDTKEEKIKEILEEYILQWDGLDSQQLCISRLKELLKK
ncbi:MAG: hypothetical protein WC346_21275 [Methanogenium sp.]|jgi:hypothetical protein